MVATLTRRGRVERRSELYGKAFENWVFHEISARNAYSERSVELSYWRLAGGAEVDFIVGDMSVAIEAIEAIEAKPTARITADHLRGSRTLVEDHPKVSQRIVVCLEPRARVTEDGIRILPAEQFASLLADGEIF